MRFIFVGERPSLTAHRQGWTWYDGRLAAKTLFDALKAANVNPHDQGFVNLFGDRPTSPLDLTERAAVTVSVLDSLRHSGVQIIAMGNRVSDVLARRDVPHLKIVHPAARGTIRGKATYAAHVREALS